MRRRDNKDNIVYGSKMKSRLLIVLLFFALSFLYMLLVDSAVLPSYDILVLVVIVLGIFLGKLLSNTVAALLYGRRISYAVVFIVHIICFAGIICIPVLHMKKNIDLTLKSNTGFLLMVTLAFYVRWSFWFIFSKKNYDTVASGSDTVKG